MSPHFPIGARVRVGRPDNPRHPRAGQVGTVELARHWPREKRTRMGRETTGPACSLLWVRFDRPGTDFALMPLFDREIERTDR